MEIRKSRRDGHWLPHGQAAIGLSVFLMLNFSKDLSSDGSFGSEYGVRKIRNANPMVDQRGGTRSRAQGLSGRRNPLLQDSGGHGREDKKISTLLLPVFFSFLFFLVFCPHFLFPNCISFSNSLLFSGTTF